MMTDHSTRLKKLTSIIEGDLPLSNLSLSDDYFYDSLSLCVLNTFFSYGRVRYRQALNVVERYCNKYGVRQCREKDDKGDNKYKCPSNSENIEKLIHRIEKHSGGKEAFTSDIINNKGRMHQKSYANLKITGVLDFAKCLRACSIDTFDDIGQFSLDDYKQYCIGEKSYLNKERHYDFFMALAGDEEVVLANACIVRYVGKIGEKLSREKARNLVKDAAKALNIKPRTLDYNIWNLDQKNKKGKAV